MRLDLFSRVLFIIYCLEAGAVLLLVPWGHGWERMIFRLPSDWARELTLHPLFRSLISAFGLLHLIWAVHDLDLLLKHRRSRERPTYPSAGDR